MLRVGIDMENTGKEASILRCIRQMISRCRSVKTSSNASSVSVGYELPGNSDSLSHSPMKREASPQTDTENDPTKVKGHDLSIERNETDDNFSTARRSRLDILL